MRVYSMSSENRLSAATENYLLSLYVLGEDGITPTASHLADYLRRLPAGEGLGTSFPSVLSMLRRMVRENWFPILSHNPLLRCGLFSLSYG